jgi:hypothetical protein
MSVSEYQHHHVLITIEAAQRNGLPENEIVRLVGKLPGEPIPATAPADEHRLIRRLFVRDRLPKAA